MPHIEAIWTAINAAPQEQRDYLVRFVSKNAHRPLDEVRAHWERDRADREHAARIEHHRREKVMREYEEIVRVTGVEPIASPGKGQ